METIAYAEQSMIGVCAIVLFDGRCHFCSGKGYIVIQRLASWLHRCGKLLVLNLAQMRSETTTQLVTSNNRVNNPSLCGCYRRNNLFLSPKRQCRHQKY